MPRTSTGTAAAGWRDEILREFTRGVARLTVVGGPDGLLAEAGMVEALRARGFEVVPVSDRVAFRYFYERGAPDIVVERLSPATAERDRGYKRVLYERHGVAEYWLVDPAEGTVSLHRRRGGALTVTHTFGRGETLHSPLLAGLNIDLDDVFSS